MASLRFFPYPQREGPGCRSTRFVRWLLLELRLRDAAVEAGWVVCGFSRTPREKAQDVAVPGSSAGCFVWKLRLRDSSKGSGLCGCLVREHTRVLLRSSLQFWRLGTSALSARRWGDCTRDQDTGASGSGLRAVEAKTVTLAFPFLLRARNHETKSRYIKQLYDVSVSHCLATVCVPNFTSVCSLRPRRHL